MIRIHLIASARPNFMKIAPLFRALASERWCKPELVNGGQHQSFEMSGGFLREFELPAPFAELKIGGGTHGEQTAAAITQYERLLTAAPADMTIVVGDVNASMGCAIAASKLQVPVGHVEAGLRSFDRTMPEEINRIVIDRLAAIHWCPSEDAVSNLANEGIKGDTVRFAGNIMMDCIEMMRTKIESCPIVTRLGLTPSEYGVVTLHRPSNVDDEPALRALVAALLASGKNRPLVFSVHPRCRKRLVEFGLLQTLEGAKHIRLIEPLGYVDFISLMSSAAFLITDSGGIQEETTYLRVPCLTVRSNTERPITLEQGTNRLVEIDAIPRAIADIGRVVGSHLVPKYWDGKTSQRIVEDLRKWFHSSQ